MSGAKVTPAQERHLVEMLPDLMWRPTGQERRSADALALKNLIVRDGYWGRATAYVLTDAGRKIAEAATKSNPKGEQEK